MSGGAEGRESWGTAACSYGVEVGGSRTVRLIERGAPLPARGRRLFTTVSDRQPAVEIHVLREEAGGTRPDAGEGEPARQEDALGPAVSVGRFLLAGIRSGFRGEPRVEVCLELDGDGILHAAARDLDTGSAQEVAFSQGRPVGHGKAPAERVQALRLRVLSLVRRARRQSAAASRLGEGGLQAEIEDMVARSRAALTSGSADELAGCRTALETLLGEMRALGLHRPASAWPGKPGKAQGDRA